MMCVQIASITRVEGDAVWVQIHAVAPRREFGPCQCQYLGPAVGDRCVVSRLAAAPDTWVVLGPI
jgi:hypothetical protein